LLQRERRMNTIELFYRKISKSGFDLPMIVWLIWMFGMTAVIGWVVLH
jgi:hypothetical protein